jgi:hypothetical protein
MHDSVTDCKFHDSLSSPDRLLAILLYRLYSENTQRITLQIAFSKGRSWEMCLQTNSMELNTTREHQLCNHSKTCQHFTKPELSHLQEPCPEPEQSSPNHPFLSKIRLKVFHQLTSWSSSGRGLLCLNTDRIKFTENNFLC